MLPFKLNKVIHKWLSVIVGLQLIIWLVTGLYFNLMDADKARGNQYRLYPEITANSADIALIPISQVSSKPPQQVELLWILGKPYYHIIYQQGAHSYQPRYSILVDAITGHHQQLNAEQVYQIALASYGGEGTLSQPEYLIPPFSDHRRQQNPMWQVTVDDELNTTIYLDPITARVIFHANDDSRLKELMLKLHFMDYANTGGFNSWLVISFAVMAFLLSITGVTWLVQLFQQGMLFPRFERRLQTVNVTFVNTGEATDIVVRRASTVLVHVVNVPS